MHHVILGNGVCGIEAALALRAREASDRITLVSAEHDHFFSRPALMYIFAGQTSLGDTEPYDRGLYERMRFERRSGRVASVDTAGHRLVFEDGARLGYDRLLLAVGSKGRTAPWPGAEGEGLHYFVTLRDLEALDRAARPGLRAAVVGGGLIGVEVAEILHHRGLRVTFVIREGWYFPAALDANESALVAEHVRGRGVEVRTGAAAERVLRGDGGRIRALRLEGGVELETDLVVASIGVQPNTAFLAGGGVALAANGAIETDEALRTTAPDVWAAGDCANVTWHDGSRRPEQLWYTARDQGRAAARSMLGDEVRYRRGTFYNSAKFFDLEWTTAGHVPASATPDGAPAVSPPGYRSWFQRMPGRFESQRIVVKSDPAGDRVVGFNMLGSRWNHEPLLDWLHERRPLEWVLKHLAEAQFDEEFSPRFRLIARAEAVS
jgi:NADPH-dependent 2,4-dienoyl-CoA reductase/sulfur reductase-like enzyme